MVENLKAAFLKAYNNNAVVSRISSPKVDELYKKTKPMVLKREKRQVLMMFIIFEFNSVKNIQPFINFDNLQNFRQAKMATK